MGYKILYLKDSPVFNITNNEILNPELLPGIMQHDYRRNKRVIDSYNTWRRNRYSSNTNTDARYMRGIEFGQSGRNVINERTLQLSLSDCYWVKDSSDLRSFGEVSPYYQNHWECARPTLYVDGALPKKWLNKDILFKHGTDRVFNEVECTRLCKLCGIACNLVVPVEQGIWVYNLTDKNVMMEQLSQSGKIGEEDDVYDKAIRLFGKSAFEMLVVDTIFGNVDRHAGNVAEMRSTDTGEYLGMAPLYDFDMVKYSDKPSKGLAEKIVKYVGLDRRYLKEVIRIADTIKRNTWEGIYINNARYLINTLRKLI